MRFIVDAQLPPALARFLETSGHTADHVAELGLETAPDRRIWEVAVERNAVIVTKDEDFSRLRATRTAGPAILWIRIGNTTREQLLQTFRRSFPQILSMLDAGEAVVELTAE